MSSNKLIRRLKVQALLIGIRTLRRGWALLLPLAISIGKENENMPNMDDLLAAIQDLDTTADAVIAALKAAAADPSKIQSMIDIISADKAKWNAAISSGTANQPTE